MLTLALFAIALFIVSVFPQTQSTFIYFLPSIYIVSCILHFFYFLVKWSEAVKPDDDTTRDVEVSPGYPRLFAIGLLVKYAMYIVVAILLIQFKLYGENVHTLSQIISAVIHDRTFTFIAMILSLIYFAIFVALQISEAHEQQISFAAAYFMLFCKEIWALIIIMLLPFAVIGTLFQPVIWLVSIPLHLFKVPIYKMSWKRTLVYRLFTL